MIRPKRVFSVNDECVGVCLDFALERGHSIQHVVVTPHGVLVITDGMVPAGDASQNSFITPEKILG